MNLLNIILYGSLFSLIILNKLPETIFSTITDIIFKFSTVISEITPSDIHPL